jgi:polysaccharide biosynthesis protein PslJ
MPVWYLLGLGALIWSLPGIVFGLDLLRRPGIRLPRGAGLLLALLAWILLSGLQMRSVPSLVLFGFRFSAFVSLAATYIWIVNCDRNLVPTRTIVQLLGALWVVLVVFGYLAILMPEVDVASPFQRLLPSAIASDDYVADLTNIRFAEAQNWLGYLVPRPSAPMTFANGWGSTLGLLTPFFVLGWVIDAPRRRRWIGRFLLVAGIVPAVVSMNRGLWLGIGLMIAFVTVRSLLSGNHRLAIRLVAAALVVVAVVLFSPLETLVADKLGGAEAGDATRASVYEEAVAFTKSSPLLGYGAPVAQEYVAVAVGTHGLIWYLLVSHGVPAAAFFLLFLGGVALRGATLRSPTGMWATSAALVCAFQVPIYGLLPQVALAGVIAAVIWRERELVARPTAPAGRPVRAPAR